MNQPMNVAVSREGESTFFARVYGWMAGGLFITAFSSFFVLANPPILKAIITTPMLMFGLFIGQIGLVIWLASRIKHMSQSKARAIFCAYAALNGVALSPIFLVYTGASIASTFFITAGTFMIFSVYGMTTKKDLTGIGNLAMMGLIGFIIASVVNFFLRSPMLYWLITYGMIAVMLALIAYDTQKLKAIHQSGIATGEMGGKMVIMGALTLYLDFVLLFVLLLRIFGNRR